MTLTAKSTISAPASQNPTWRLRKWKNTSEKRSAKLSDDYSNWTVRTRICPPSETAAEVDPAEVDREKDREATPVEDHANDLARDPVPTLQRIERHAFDWTKSPRKRSR
uniref:(northern house mosquito) hypothetical protein n=1 Tax=Culex pipiens TaxID=7175 RepID=A0A8D8CPW5_CULPI